MSCAELILPSGINTSVSGRCVQQGQVSLPGTGTNTVVVPCAGFDGATMVVITSVLNLINGTQGLVETKLSGFTAGTSFEVSSTQASQESLVAYQVWESSARRVDAP